MNTNIVICLFSAYICEMMLWGWWLKFVFKRLGLMTHPSSRRPLPHNEPISILMHEMLINMRRCQFYGLLVFGYLFGAAAETALEALVSGITIAALLWFFPSGAVVQSSKQGHQDLFRTFVKWFTSYNQK